MYLPIIVIAALLVAAPVLAQPTARLQVIHNAADPAASVVDVYVEEVSTTEPFIDNFAFRTATPFVDVPAGVELTVTVAPGSSSSASDGLASFVYTLDEGGTYQLIASGVLDPSAFEANPNGEAIGFTLLASASVREEPTNKFDVDVAVVHGATDAPQIDVVTRDSGVFRPALTLANDVVYGETAPYRVIEALTYFVEITPGGPGNDDTILAAFELDLERSGFIGTALTILASGFFTPENDQGGPALALLVVLPDGTTEVLEQISGARLQVIHNAPDPAVAEIDVYIEEVSTEEPIADNLGFRQATPYFDAADGTELTVVIAPADSESSDDAIGSFTYELLPGGTYQLIASGVLDPDAFEPNPNGLDTTFDLVFNEEGEEEYGFPSNALLNVIHGAPDVTALSLIIDGIDGDPSVIVNDLVFGGILDYGALDAEPWVFTFTPTVQYNVTLAEFDVDFEEYGGEAISVLLSGFLTPDNDQNGPPLDLLFVASDGSTALASGLPVASEDGSSAPSAFALRGAYPNPFATTTTVQFDLAADARVGLEVYDVLGRRVLSVSPELRAAGAGQRIELDAGSLPSGVYLYRLTAETNTETLSRTGRMTVVR